MDRNSRLVSDLLTASVVGKPGRIALTQLIEAEIIARVRVESVVEKRLPLSHHGKPESFRLAEAVVLQPIKRTKASQRLQFSVSPSWVCDSCDAKPGETILLFLDRFEGRLLQYDHALNKSYELDVPVPLRRDVYQIANSGRGRMPIEAGKVTPELIYDLDKYFPRPKGIEEYEPFPIPLAKFESAVLRLLQKLKR